METFRLRYSSGGGKAACGPASLWEAMLAMWLDSGQSNLGASHRFKKNTDASAGKIKMMKNVGYRLSESPLCIRVD